MVIGTRTEIDLQKSPAAAGVVTREEMQLRGTQLLDQNLSLLAGVYPHRTKGPQDTTIGVGMRGFNGRGVDGARVLVLLDGQPLNSPMTALCSGRRCRLVRSTELKLSVGLYLRCTEEMP